MSDPLGVTASVIAVLQLAATATQYLKDVKNGSTDRTRLRDELRSSVCLLEMLKDRLEDNDDTTHAGNSLKPSSIQSLASSEGPLNLFRRILEEIIAKLAPQDRLRRFSQPFTWPFDKRDISELLSSLERLKSFLNLVLQNELMYGFLAQLVHPRSFNMVCANLMIATLQSSQISSLMTSATRYKALRLGLKKPRSKRLFSGSAQFPSAQDISGF